MANFTLDQNLQIPEIYALKHINDNEIHKGFDYQDNLLTEMTSDVMLGNPIMASFMSQFQSQMICMLESTLVCRNFFNHVVSKFYNRHNN